MFNALSSAVSVWYEHIIIHQSLWFNSDIFHYASLTAALNDLMMDLQSPCPVV